MKVAYDNLILNQKINWKTSFFPLGIIHNYLIPPFSWLNQIYLDLEVEAIQNLDIPNPKEYTFNVNMHLKDILQVLRI